MCDYRRGSDTFLCLPREPRPNTPSNPAFKDATS
jgi:hypothetical protein